MKSSRPAGALVSCSEAGNLQISKYLCVEDLISHREQIIGVRIAHGAKSAVQAGKGHQRSAQVARIPFKAGVVLGLSVKETIFYSVQQLVLHGLVAGHEVVICHAIPVGMLVVNPVLERQVVIGGGDSRKARGIQLTYRMVTPTESIGMGKPVLLDHAVKLRSVEIAAREPPFQEITQVGPAKLVLVAGAGHGPGKIAKDPGGQVGHATDDSEIAQVIVFRSGIKQRKRIYTSLVVLADGSPRQQIMLVGKKGVSGRR